MYIVLCLWEKLNTLMHSLEVSHEEASSGYIKMCLEISEDTHSILIGLNRLDERLKQVLVSCQLDDSEVQILHVLSSISTTI